MCAAAVLPITDCWIGIRFGPSFLGDETDFSHCFLKSTIACSRAHEAISNDRQLREYVSVTDMKNEIEFRRITISIGRSYTQDQRPAQRRLLDHIMS
jgi:hypothetical protein